MELLFGGKAIFVFFFAMIAIYNYSNLKEYQRITIIYVTIYCLRLTGVVGSATAFIYLSIALFCFFEILTDDEKKLQIVINPIFKLLDAVYLSLAQYAVLSEILAILLAADFVKFYNECRWGAIIFGVLSLAMMTATVTMTLQQRFVTSTFSEMYQVFADNPINRFEVTEKLCEANAILVSLEDRLYYERAGYTNYSIKIARTVINERAAVEISDKLSDKMRYLIFKIRVAVDLLKTVIGNIISHDRGYSTIPMQLVRSLGLKRGYNCSWRRKAYECIYSKIFLDGIMNYYEVNNYSGRDNIKVYLLYIYFLSVQTYFEKTGFISFLDALKELEGDNIETVTDASSEAIFVACLGLSKNADGLTIDEIEYNVSRVDSVELDCDKIYDLIHNKI